jgi:Ca-activated chloride channel homolog
MSPATLQAEARPAIVLLVVALCLLVAWWRERQLRAATVAWRAGETRGPRRAAAWLRVLLLTLAGGAAAGTLLAEPAAPASDDPRTMPEALMIVLDVSRSMEAGDVAPTRLEAARGFLTRLMAQISPAAVGLLVFAGEPALICPLTTDPSALQMALGEVVATRDAIPGGSALGPALARAVDAFGPRRQRRTLLLVSDGEETTTDAAETLTRMRAAGVVVHAVGVGTRAGTPMATRRQAAGTATAPGDTRVTRLSPAILTRLSGATGGLYVEGTEERALAQIAGRLQSPDADRSAGSTWPSTLLLLAAFAGLLAERWARSGRLM